MRFAVGSVLASSCVFSVEAAVFPAEVAPHDFERCTIGNEVALIDAECRYVSVPLDPDAAQRGDLQLLVARIAADTADAAADPLLLIAGGPGQAASESFPAVIQAFRHVRRHRDLLLIDQRGTGRSHRLDCADSGSDPLREPDADAITQLARHCIETLDTDPSVYTTSVAVRDLERIRELLGIERWNLYGVSYGSRVALHYLRRYPEAVRSVILDAAVPPGVPLGPAIARHAQAALDAIFHRCGQDRGCREAFPTIAADTDALFEALEQAPVPVTFEDIGNGSTQTIEFTARHLAIALRLLSYSAYGAAILPSMLADAVHRHNYAPLARQSLLQLEQLEDAFATGMHNAVVCTEDVPFIDKVASPKTPDDTYLGQDLLEALKATCAAWPAGRRDADFGTPVHSAVPTLVLSGGADPITPPAYGNRVITTLDTALHIVNADQGHMQAPLGCMPRIIGRFIEQADIESLPLHCLDRLLAPAFFVDANGPLP